MFVLDVRQALHYEDAGLRRVETKRLFTNFREACKWDQTDAVLSDVNFNDPWDLKQYYPPFFRKAPKQEEIQLIIEQESAKKALKKGDVFTCALRYMALCMHLDEGHAIKNPATQRHRAPYCTYAPKVRAYLRDHLQ